MVKHTQTIRGQHFVGLVLKGLNKQITGVGPILTHFMPLFSFYTPENIRKPEVLGCFLAGIERDQWHKIGYVVTKENLL